jgi:cation transport ATPase
MLTLTTCALAGGLLMHAPGAARRRARLDGALTVFVGIDHAPAGVFVLNDQVRPDTASTIQALRRSGISRIVIVTGSGPKSPRRLAW